MTRKRRTFTPEFKQKAPPDIRDDAIELTAEELNWMLDGFDLWRNRPHKVLRPRYVA